LIRLTENELAIIEILQQNPAISKTELSLKLGLHRNTVANTTKKLEEAGILRNLYGVNPTVLGYSGICFFAAKVEKSELETVVEHLVKHKEITCLGTLMGEKNLGGQIVSPNPDVMLKFVNSTIRSQPGVKDVTIFLFLEIFKNKYIIDLVLYPSI
jgi:DNA-binding Lrp family transcriptional regulator